MKDKEDIFLDSFGKDVSENIKQFIFCGAVYLFWLILDQFIDQEIVFNYIIYEMNSFLEAVIFSISLYSVLFVYLFVPILLVKATFKTFQNKA